LYKNYNLDVNHQKFSSFALEKILSRQVDIIAYRGDSRDPSIIFNNEKRNLIEDREFIGIKKYLNSVFFDLVNKEFVFSIDEIIKK
jgi:hypothetical protein